VLEKLVDHEDWGARGRGATRSVDEARRLAAGTEPYVKSAGNP
jgi:hypothetical protein